MEQFSIGSAASHPFLRAADQALIITLEIAGYDASERRQVLRTVRSSFKGALQDVLSGEQREKFAGFTQWLELDTDDKRMSRDLLAYADQQRADLEDKPALGIEPFAVSDVYIETECGVLPWRAIHDEKVDPFKESSAPREDLMTAVLKRMGRKGFNDAIVVQGAPGAGKSTFTKQLCMRLTTEGLTPVRIPMQFLRVDVDLFDAVKHVVVNQSDASVSFRAEVLREKVFTERVPFGEEDISAYVFVFDGSGESRIYFCNYVKRINGSGLNPPGSHGDFPGGTVMMGVFLADTIFQFMVLSRANLAFCDFQDALLQWALLVHSNLELANLRGAGLEFSSMSRVRANGTDFEGANLTSVDLDSAVLQHAIGLTADQLDVTAAGRGAKSLPPGLYSPPQWNRPLNGPTRLRM